jgi:predicted amidohydrolase
MAQPLCRSGRTAGVPRAARCRKRPARYVQLQARAVENFAEFVQNVEYFVDVAADYRADFVVFPELFTMSLLSFEADTLSPMAAIDRMTEHRGPVVAELSRMALRYNINIVGGSHPTRT